MKDIGLLEKWINWREIESNEGEKLRQPVVFGLIYYYDDENIQGNKQEGTSKRKLKYFLQILKDMGCGIFREELAWNIQMEARSCVKLDLELINVYEDENILLPWRLI